MADWVPFHAELCAGNKRGLSRATRFIYLELSQKARKGRGVIRLAVGMSDLDAVHDLIGGSRKEVAEALARLTAPLPGDDEGEPMILLEGAERARTLRIASWERWSYSKEAPGSSTARVTKHRTETKKKRVLTDGETAVTTVTETNCNENVTVGNGPYRERDIEREISPETLELRSETSEPPGAYGSQAAASAPASHGLGDPTQGGQEAPGGAADDPEVGYDPIDASWLAQRLTAPVFHPLVSCPEALDDMAGRLATSGAIHADVEGAISDYPVTSRRPGTTAAQLVDGLMGFVATAKRSRRTESRPFTKREQEAHDLWAALWSREHRGATFPSSDVDRRMIRILTAKAAARAGKLGNGVRVGDVLRHYFERYLKIDDKLLVQQRYPLALLESRMNAIGEYELPKPKSPAKPEPSPVDVGAVSMPPAAFEQLMQATTRLGSGPRPRGAAA